MSFKNTFQATATAALMWLGSVSAAAEEVTLRGVSCLSIGNPVSRYFEQLVEDVNAQGKGVLQIKMIGGAPAIGSPYTLTRKVSKGIYDIIGCPQSYFGNVIPEAPVLGLSGKSFAELRRNGAIEYIEKILNEKNIHFVSRHVDFGPFNLWLNKKINSPDLTGLNLRVAPSYSAFFRALGASVQTAPPSQIYTLMENNTVQGFGWPAGVFVPSWIKVTKYQVKTGFYQSTVHTLVNLEKWQSLNAEQQALITKIGLQYEQLSDPGNAWLTERLAKGKAFRAAEGVELIEFSAADQKKMKATAQKAAWEEIYERSPKHGAALAALFGSN